MILIADSGSSKTDWRLIAADGTILQAKTKGYNPYYQPIADLQREIREGVAPLVSQPVGEVYYYGTGSSSDENRRIIAGMLTQEFPSARVEVNHDLIAAARALCGTEEGIACILGTGSSSCLYDGHAITESFAGLGYVLGDEGSGAYLGRNLLADMLTDAAPPALQAHFHKRFPLDRGELLDRVYKNEKPARFLAEFTHFIFHHINEAYCHQLVSEAFRAFFRKSIKRHSRHDQVRIHFTGSVAFYFANILRQVAADEKVTVKNIAESPIAGLTLYHQQAR